MAPGVAQVVVFLVVALACAFIGQAIGRPKGYPGVGFAVGLLLALLGVVIVALMPETEAVKAARAYRQYEAQVAAAQREYEIQAEAARRAGYPPPPGPWQLPQDWPPANP